MRAYYLLGWNRKQKLDSNLHEDIVSDISDVKRWRHHLNKKRRHSVLWWFRLGPKDETPMRFLIDLKLISKIKK